MADSDHPGIPPSRHEDKRKGKKGAEKGKDRPLPQPTGQVGNVDDPNIEGLERRRRYGKCGNELPAWPPSPSDTDAWAEVLRERPDLAPATAESEVRGVADGMAGGLDNIRRAGLLRVLGNGVVPQQAATALTILYERMNDGR